MCRQHHAGTTGGELREAESENPSTQVGACRGGGCGRDRLGHDAMRKMILSIIFPMCFVYSHAMSMELKTVYQENAPPRYINKNGQVFGVCIDIINALNSRLRKRDIRIVSIHNNVPFARLRKQLELGEIDVAFCITRNKKRENLYRYTNNLYKIHYTFAKLKSDPFEYTGEASLQDKG